MRVFILKEGKEHNQGVAYLDDGTMVVVENARRMIGRTLDITVTSVLQTTAGKMIFGRFEEPRHAERPHPERERPSAQANHTTPRSPGNSGAQRRFHPSGPRDSEARDSSAHEADAPETGDPGVSRREPGR
jgi:hypothetical protein